MVRAKFKVDCITRRMSSRQSADSAGKTVYVPAEVWSVKLSPVYQNGDPNHENNKFWAATPTGSIELTCVNADAVRQFDLDGEFYVDFTPAG
jgi:hypothetical protein